MQTPEEYLKAILTGFIQFPDEIRIERKDDEQGVLLSISVAEEDMGSVIGREGENANTVRKLLRLYGHKNQQRISLKIIDRIQDR